MNKTISDISKLLDSLNNKLKVKLVTEKDMLEIEEQIKEFESDLTKLQATIASAENATKIGDYTEIIAHLYMYLGDIIQDLENIHEITTMVAQRYSKEFLDNK
jgi:predicted  nucleic acid-binding Zn-ribbon protein